jgi:hypothetical protein
MGNVNCSQICGPSDKEGLALDNNEISGTPMRPAKVVTETEDMDRPIIKKSVFHTPDPSKSSKVNIDHFGKKIVSIDKRFSTIKYRRTMKRWRAATESIKPVQVVVSSSNDGDFDERLKKLGNFVSEDDMRRQTKDIVIGLERQLGPLKETDSKAQGKSLTTKGPFKYHQDRSIYKGTWSQDLKKHGFGVLVKEDGSKYEGAWENDEQSGYGRYFDSKGNYFVGISSY